jgi:hypothetical protein
MGEKPQLEARAELERGKLKRTGSDLEQKFPVALVLYGILAALAWYTLGEGKVLVGGKPVELRLLPVIIIAGLALRTILARQADKIRRSGDGDRS